MRRRAIKLASPRVPHAQRQCLPCLPAFPQTGWRHAWTCQSSGGTAMASTAEGVKKRPWGVNTDRV
jgi:hypothetical protein